MTFKILNGQNGFDAILSLLYSHPLISYYRLLTSDTHLCAKDQTSLDFVADTESTGIKIDTSGSLSDGHLRCIRTAMNEYRDIGPELYVEALTIIVDAWAACADSLKFDIIKGLCRFVWYYHDEYNRERLVWRLNQLKPSDISDRIKLDIKTPPEKRFIKPFFEIYNGSSRIGALPKRF